MIIERIQARNFMRFRDLDIRALPASGALAVVGPNESGKSAIGEAICFAMFGATPRAPAEKAERVIRWGTSSCRVELTFEIADRGRYRVIREIDREGGRHTVIKPADADLVIAEGNEDVGKELFSLLGFRFEEFRYSFYLAQNELDLVDVGQEEGTRRVIYRMLGIDVLNRGSHRVKADLETLTRSLRSDREDLKLSRALVETAGFDPAEARAVEEDLQRLKAEEQGRRNMVESEEALLKTHEEAIRFHESLFKSLSFLRSALRLAFLKSRFMSASSRVGGLACAGRAALKSASTDLENTRGERAGLRANVESLSEFLKDRDRLLDLCRVFGANLKSDSTAGGAGRHISTADDLEEVKHRLTSDRRSRVTSSVQAVLATAGMACVAFVGLGMQRNADFAKPLLAMLPPDSRMPVVLASAGVFLLFFAISAARLVTVGRSISHNREFRDQLEQKLQKMKVESGAIEAIAANRCARLADHLPFVSNPDIQDCGNRVLSRHRNLLDEPKPEEALERDKGLLAAADERVSSLEHSIGKRSVITGLLERRASELSEGRAEVADIIRAAAPIDWPDDLDAMDAEAVKLTDSASELKNLISSAEEEAGGLESIDILWQDVKSLTDGLNSLLDAVTGQPCQPDFERFEDFAFDYGPDGSNPREKLAALDEEIGRLRSAFPAEEELKGRREKVRYDLEQERAKVAGLSARIEGLEREYRRLAPRLTAHNELLGRIIVLEGRIGPLEHDIAVRRALSDLFNGTVVNIKNRFGPAIGRFVGSILPRITKERYGKVQVSADLDIAVFSRERNDFAMLDEISGGTRDQVLICLRLALAQALLQARMGIERKQFLFLDEPISSFDDERSLLFLDLVKGFSPNFEQIFVTIHTVSSTPGAYKGVISTSLEDDRLDIDLS